MKSGFPVPHRQCVVSTRLWLSPASGCGCQAARLLSAYFPMWAEEQLSQSAEPEPCCCVKHALAPAKTTRLRLTALTKSAVDLSCLWIRPWLDGCLLTAGPPQVATVVQRAVAWRWAPFLSRSDSEPVPCLHKCWGTEGADLAPGEVGLFCPSPSRSLQGLPLEQGHPMRQPT